jgi:hypothetical protein
VVEVQLLETAVVEGEAYLASGEPANGKRIYTQDKGRIRSAAVDGDGRFRLEGVAVDSPDGSSEGLGLVEDFDRAKITMVKVAVKPGETTRVVIGSPKGARATVTIRGTVKAGGVPLPGVLVMARNLESRDAAVERTDDAGAYVAQGIPAGKLETMIYLCDPRVTDDYYLRHVEPLETRGGEERTFDFDLPGGAFRVRVVDDATGKPVTGARVWAAPEEGKEDTESFPGWTYRPGFAAFTADGGVADLVALVPGNRHTVSAWADGDLQAGATGLVPGTAEQPAEVVLRVRKKP